MGLGRFRNAVREGYGGMNTAPGRPHESAPAPEVPRRMWAAVRERYGPVETLQVREVGVPAAASDEVLIEVAAAGVDRGVWHLLTGLPYVMRVMGFGFRRPRQPVLGADVSGRVVAVGRDVTRHRVGDAVFGSGRGTFAEYACAHENEVAAKPARLSFVQAAALTVSGSAAVQALHEAGHVRGRQRVLVLGASGGVGTFAMQLARIAGAEVTAVASAAKLDLVERLGADRVIDYGSTDATDGSFRYDLIVDIGGRTRLGKLRRALTHDGRLVIVGGENGGVWTGGVGRQLRAAALSPWVKQNLTSLISSTTPQRLAQLRSAVESGVVPAVERTHALDEVGVALRALEAGQIRGKRVIDLGRAETADSTASTPYEVR